MIRAGKLALAYVTVAAVFLIALITLTHWPLWAGLLAVFMVAAGPWLAVGRWLHAGQGGTGQTQATAWEDGGDFDTESQLARWDTPKIRLPSRWPGYDFSFTATVRWRAARGEDVNSEISRTAAVAAITNRAREFTELRTPPDIIGSERELRRTLSELRSHQDGHSQVQALAEVTTIELAEPSPTDHFAAFVSAAGFSAPDPGATLLAHQVARTLAGAGKQSLAGEIWQRFDVPAEDGSHD